MKSLSVSPSSEVVLLGFRKNLIAQGYRINTIELMVSVLFEFVNRMEAKGIFHFSEISGVDIQEHYQYLFSRPNFRKVGNLSSSMLTQHIYSIRTFFAWLELLKSIEVNPLADLKFPKLFVPMRKALSKQEIKNLYQVCENDRDFALLTLYYACGLRRTEGHDLNCKDILYSESKLIVRSGKFSKRREVPLHPMAMKYLRNYQLRYRVELIKRSKVDLSDAFLVGNNGERMSGKACLARLKYLAKKAGIASAEISLHHLRHSIATHLRENGMPIDQIMQFLGHSTMDVTQGYLEGYRTNWQKQNTQRKRVFYDHRDTNELRK